MSYSTITLLITVAASGIVSAWLYFRLRAAQATLAASRVELAAASARRAELAAQVLTLNGSLAKSQESARKYYDQLTETIKSAAKPGTPGSADRSIGFLREAINGSRTDDNPTSTLRPPPGAKAPGEPDNH